MTNKFRKLMREQIEKSLSSFQEFVYKPTPKTGWIRTIRSVLGMSSSALAKRLNCSRSNISTIEQREIKNNISLNTLKQVAEAMDCKLIYFIVPNESFDAILEKQAQLVAKKRIKSVNHSMMLEQQGLTKEQLRQQENDLIQELLQGDPKNLWNDK